MTGVPSVGEKSIISRSAYSYFPDNQSQSILSFETQVNTNMFVQTLDCVWLPTDPRRYFLTSPTGTPRPCIVINSNSICPKQVGLTTTIQLYSLLIAIDGDEGVPFSSNRFA